MQASMFNVRVPLDTMGKSDDVFLMNTFTDAQLIVSRTWRRCSIRSGRVRRPR